MLKYILIAVVVVVAGVLIYAATMPDTFRVQRSASIKAAPEKIAPLIADFHQWQAWSPYEKYDPAMKRDYSGAASGVGAIYAWSGNGKVGAGRMEILDSSTQQVRIKLDFIKPFEGHNTATFTLAPAGDATSVTWAMDGPRPYISKLMGVFFNMDKLIGKDFEEGLANLGNAAAK